MTTKIEDSKDWARAMVKVGKRKAGRTLDGVVWDQRPAMLKGGA